MTDDQARISARLLVVDDERFISDALSASLRFRGFTVDTAATGLEALRKILTETPDLVLLDVTLPDTDGFTLVRQLRSGNSTVPVIFVTASDTPRDRVAGLTIGGDDYVTKPFGLDEVAARVHAVLRRSTPTAAPRTPSSPELLEVADLEMDQASHRVRRAGTEIELSPTEYRLLRYLMVNAGRVVSREQILDQVWQRGYVGDQSVVATYISALRRKVDTLGAPLIHTRRSFGYCIRAA